MNHLNDYLPKVGLRHGYGYRKAIGNSLVYLVMNLCYR
jgi:hypothetical protein